MRNKSEPTADDFLLVEEAADLVRHPQSTIRWWVATGKLRAYRPGKRVLIRRADLIAFIEGARVQ